MEYLVTWTTPAGQQSCPTNDLRTAAYLARSSVNRGHTPVVVLDKQGRLVKV